MSTFILATVMLCAAAFLGYLFRWSSESSRFGAAVDAEVLRRIQIEREAMRQRVTAKVAGHLAVIRGRLDRETIPGRDDLDDDCGPVCAWPVSQRES